MTSEFYQAFDSESETIFGTCQHLLGVASANSIDTGCQFGLSADMSAAELQSIAAELEASIAAEAQARALADRWICDIGPYDGGFCTICGGRQP